MTTWLSMLGRNSLLLLVRRSVVRWLVSVVALLLLVWFAAARGIGMRPIVRVALDRATPDGWSVEVGAVEGDWRSRIRLEGLDITGDGMSAAAGRVTVEYGLRGLLSKTIDLRRVAIEQPTIVIDPDAVPPTVATEDHGTGRGDETSSYTLADLLSDRPLGAWSIAVSDLSIRDGHVDVRHPRGRWQAAGVHLAALGGLATEGLTFDVDSLSADVVASAQSGDADSVAAPVTGRLAAAARLRRGLLEVRTFTFHSRRSRVEGGGTLTLAPIVRVVDTVEFELTARPLDLRDLPIALPEGVLEYPETVVEVAARGTVDSIHVDARIEGPRRLDARANAIVRRPRAASSGPALRATISLAEADLSGLSPAPFDGVVDGRLALTLERWDTGAGLHAKADVLHRPATPNADHLLGRALRADVVATREGGGVDDRVRATDVTVRLHDAEPTATGPRSAGATHSLGLTGDAWRELGEISLHVGRQRVRWRADLRLDSATAAGSGTGWWSPDGRGIEVEQLAVERLDPYLVHEELAPASITGAVDGRIEGNTLADAKGSLQVRLASSSVEGVAVDSLFVDAALAGATIEGRVEGLRADTRLTSSYRVALEDTVLVADLADLRVGRTGGPEQSDPASVMHVTGAVDGRWSLTEGERRGALRASLDSASYGSVRLGPGTLRAELVGERLSAQTELEVRDILPGLTIVRGTLSTTGLAPAEMAGTAELTAVRRHGASPPQASGAAVPSEADSSLPTDSLALELRAAEPGRLELSGSLQPSEGGQLLIDGSGSISDPDASFDLSARGALAAPTALLADARVDSVSLEASARRFGDRWSHWDARLEATRAGWRTLTADTLRAVARADSIGFHLDTLRLESNVLTLDGTGTLPIARAESGAVQLVADLTDLEPVRRLTGAEILSAGAGELRLTLRGALDSISVSTAVGLRAIALDKVRLTGLDLRGQALVKASGSRPFGLTSGDFDLQLDRVVLPDSEVRGVHVTGEGGPDSVRLDASALVDDRRRGSMLVRVDPRPDRRTVRIERLDLQLDQDEWALAEPAVLTYRDGYSIRSFRLRAGDQEISVDGGVTGTGTLDVSVDMDSTDIATVSDLVGLPGLHGWLGGRLRLQGTTESPEGRAVLEGAFHRAEWPPGRARVAVDTDNRTLRVDVDLEDPAGGRLRVDGSMGLPRALTSSRPPDTGRSGFLPHAGSPGAGDAARGAGDLDLTLVSDSFALSWTLPFFDAALLSELRGRLGGELRARGTTADPIFDGTLQLRDGGARFPRLGVEWERVDIVVRGDGTELIVDSARVRDGSSGGLRAFGSITPTDGVALDLNAGFDDFQAIRNDSYWATLSGQLDASGTLAAPILQGRVRAESIDIFLDERLTDDGLEDVELSDADLRMLRERFGYVPAKDDAGRPQLTDRLTADLVVELGRDSWLRKRANPEMAVSFTGNLDVRMRPGEEPNLRGSLQTITERGFVEQFGRRFELRDGTVTFDGPPTSAHIDLAATYTIPSHDNPDDAEATIVLEIEGTQGDLGLTLSSEPAMENADIVSYIATGRPASGSLSLGAGGPDQSEGGLVAAGTNLALGQVAGLVEGAAERSVGLDVVEIRREGLREATLVAGKYVSPRLYVGFAQPVTLREGDGLSLGGEGESEVEIELEALRWLLLNIEGSGSALRLFLRGRYAY